MRQQRQLTQNKFKRHVLLAALAATAVALTLRFSTESLAPETQEPTQTSAVELAVPPSSSQQKAPLKRPPPHSSSEKNEGNAPTTLPNDLPLAKTACSSETLTDLRDSNTDCTQEVLALRARIENRIGKLQESGITYDEHQCTATDKNGDTTRLDAMGNELAHLSKLIVQRGLAFTFEGDYGELPFKRAHLVALCSIKKSMDYWATHSSEIPPSDRIEDYLFFDTEKGKPQESYVTGVFVRTMAYLNKLKPAPTTSSAPN